MQDFKKEIFNSSHGTDIQCQKPTEKDKSLIKDYLELRLGKNVELNDFFNLIREQLPRSITFESLESTAEIEQALCQLELMSQKYVIVIWKYMEDMDKFDLKYLIKYWEDIWFSSSDETVCLFFPESIKMILITHYNVIYTAPLSRPMSLS